MGESEGSQQYCLRWNNHSDSIITEFEILLGQEDFVDVTLSCDKKSVKAHKVVLSACSSYFRRLLRDNPCQHPIIILRDVGYEELRSILYFMYHGQVMVDQERIPQLLQTAQLLEVRGLSEIKEGEESNASAGAPEATTGTSKGSSQSFLAGLLNSSGVSTTKRPMSVASDSRSNSSPTPPPAAKRQRGSSAASRPVPMLQSILSQQLAVPNTPTFDLAMGSSTRALTALANKVQGGRTLPTSLENLLSSNSNSAGHRNNNGGLEIHSTSSSSSSEDVKDRLAESATSYGDLDRTGSSQGREMESDTAVEIKEEPLMHFIEDEFCDEDMNNRTAGGVTGDEESDSEAEMSENSRGDGSRVGFAALPLLAQHLAAASGPSSSTSLLTASAKLRAAASQARHLSGGSATDGNPLIAQVIMGPSSPSDSGPASVSSDSASPSFDPLGGDPPRKLAFHEPRPCPICRRMYRDAATLRTHTAIMHAEGRDPFACMCGELFRTKYEMYNHKKNGHR